MQRLILNVILIKAVIYQFMSHDLIIHIFRQLIKKKSVILFNQHKTSSSYLMFKIIVSLDLYIRTWLFRSRTDRQFYFNVVEQTGDFTSK
jgi:hypothetical protein